MRIFIMVAVVLGMTMTASSLKCYIGAGSDYKLQECPALVPGPCAKAGNSGTMVRSCMNKNLVDLLKQAGHPGDGCMTQGGATSCLCNTDGCNTGSFTKSSKIIQPAMAIIAMISGSPLMRILLA